MVLGLVNFLLGGKKKTKVSKSGQATTPMNKVGGAVVSNDLPDGQETPTQNNSDLNFKDSNPSPVNSSDATPVSNSQSVQEQSSTIGNGFQKRSISQVIGKINEQLIETNEKIGGLVTDVRTVQNSVNSLGHRIDDLEESKKVSEEKINDIDSNMGKFLSLYELINNQYNPFVEKSEIAQKIEISADGNSMPSKPEEPKSFEDLDLKNADFGISSENDLNSSLLELDTLDIEEAAGDAVPLTKLKNNTNSLVVILSWLEYLIKRVGIDETRNSLRYYTETLRWVTPEVFFDLDKYLRGMKDKKDIEEDARLTVKDHIVSLYFISKLNEKTLDVKLTKAVLQIIKQ